MRVDLQLLAVGAERLERPLLDGPRHAEVPRRFDGTHVVLDGDSQVVPCLILAEAHHVQIVLEARLLVFNAMSHDCSPVRSDVM